LKLCEKGKKLNEKISQMKAKNFSKNIKTTIKLIFNATGLSFYPTGSQR
jgi:hypothetical protein